MIPFHTNLRTSYSFTEAPDLDTRIIAARYDLVFTQRKTADSSLVTHKRSSAPPFLTRPHLRKLQHIPQLNGVDTP